MAVGGKEYKWIWIGAGLAVILVGMFVFIPLDNRIEKPIAGISELTPPEQTTATAIRNGQQTATLAPKGSAGETDSQKTSLSNTDHLQEKTSADKNLQKEANLPEVSTSITRRQQAVPLVQKDPVEKPPLQKAFIPNSNELQKTTSDPKEQKKETAASEIPTATIESRQIIEQGRKDQQKETTASEIPTSIDTKPQTAKQKRSHSTETARLSNKSIPRVDKPKEGTPAKKEVLKQDPLAKSIVPVLDYNKLDRDPALQVLMEKRKKQLGIDGGVDIIARLDESIKIGDQVIPMKEIIDQIRIKKGGIVEKNLSSAETTSVQKPVSNPEFFGIHVVQPGENIWNIHFTLLKSYFAHKGMSLSLMADEPLGDGQSSGIGKLLKFSENIVYIYNIRKRKLAEDLHVIIPLTKIVIYNMERIFSLLDQIDYEHLNRIQFDGITVWIPS